MDDSSDQVVEELIPNLIINTLQPLISQNSRIMEQARRKCPISPDSDGNITQQSKLDLNEKIRHLRNDIERPKQFKDHIRERTRGYGSKLDLRSKQMLAPTIKLKVSLKDQDFNLVMLDQDGSYPMIQKQESGIGSPNNYIRKQSCNSLSPISIKQPNSARQPNSKQSSKYQHRTSKESHGHQQKSKKAKQSQPQYPLLSKTTEESKTKLNSLQSKNQSQVSFIKGDNQFQFLHKIHSQDSPDLKNNLQNQQQKKESVRHQQRLLTGSNSPKKPQNLTYSTKRDSNGKPKKQQTKKAEIKNDSPPQLRKLDNLAFMDAGLRAQQNVSKDKNRRSSALSVLSVISKASGCSTPKSILKSPANDHQSMMSCASSNNSARSPIRPSINKKVRFSFKKKRGKVSSQL